MITDHHAGHVRVPGVTPSASGEEAHLAAGEPDCPCHDERPVGGEHGTSAALAQHRRELETEVAEYRRALADTRRELAEEMRRREQAEAALHHAERLATLGQLASGIVHDVRNALQPAIGAFDILADDLADPAAPDIIALGRRAVGHASELVRSILSFARKGEPTAAPIRPAELLAEIAGLLRHVASARVRVTFDVAPGVWPVFIDVQRLEAALVNLVGNARDAMPGGGNLTVSVRNVPRAEPKPAALPARGYVLFTVLDSGTGMTPEVLRRATEPFFTTKGPGLGTGLGLAMVHALATDAGGCIQIESAPGEGTRVEVYLPRDPGAPLSIPPPPPSQPAPQGKPCVVLLVDDDDLIRTVTAVHLRELGHEVVTAANAALALAHARSLGDLDLLITDVMMPGMDGPELVRRLRQTRPDLPVIYISGDREAARSLAGDDVITKPFSAAELERLVAERARRPDSWRERRAMLHDRLMSRLRTPMLKEAYTTWVSAVRDGKLPRLADVEPRLAAYADHMYVAAAGTDERSDLVFRFSTIGQALRASLLGPFEGADLLTSQEELIGTMEGAYRRAVKSRTPSYEYARHHVGDEPPVLFERLLLPASDDGEKVTHLIGVVWVVELAVIKETA